MDRGAWQATVHGMAITKSQKNNNNKRVSLWGVTWVWVNSGSWWWTGRPGVLQSMGLQRVRHDWVTELNWTELMGCKGWWSLREPVAISEDEGWGRRQLWESEGRSSWQEFCPTVQPAEGCSQCLICHRERAGQGINILAAISIPYRGRASFRAAGSGSGGARRKRPTQVGHMWKCPKGYSAMWWSVKSVHYWGREPELQEVGEMTFWPFTSYVAVSEFIRTAMYKGFPRWLSGNESACQAGDASSIPGLGRSSGKEMATDPVVLPGESQGQKSLVGAIVYGVSKESDTS